MSVKGAQWKFRCGRIHIVKNSSLNIFSYRTTAVNSNNTKIVSFKQMHLMSRFVMFFDAKNISTQTNGYTPNQSLCQNKCTLTSNHERDICIDLNRERIFLNICANFRKNVFWYSRRCLCLVWWDYTNTDREEVGDPDRKLGSFI